MRWLAKQLTYYDWRVVRKFLWIPRNFGGTQYRWLEFARVYQRAEWVFTIFGNSKLKWVDTGFYNL